MAQTITQKKAAVVTATRKDRESSSALLRRFTQYVQKSGLVQEVRERRYFIKDANRNARRKSALVRANRREEYTKLYKLGKTMKKK